MLYLLRKIEIRRGRHDTGRNIPRDFFCMTRTRDRGNIFNRSRRDQFNDYLRHPLQGFDLNPFGKIDESPIGIMQRA